MDVAFVDSMSTGMRVVIADDEPIARAQLAKMLELHSDRLEIVATCRDGAEAVIAVEDLAPDVVFLDIQMPELDGFGVVRQIIGDRMPLVVFVTAFDDHAIEAFRVHAVDYVLKPFDVERIRATVDQLAQRVTERMATSNRDHHQAQVRALLGELPKSKTLERVVLKVDGRRVVVRADDIAWIEAANNDVRFHIGKEAHIVRGTLASLQDRLDPELFVRVHRSSIVNVRFVREVQPWFRGDLVALLHTGAKVTVSRRYRSGLLDKIGIALD